jgi:AcrR family transcriptional regulator
MLDAAVAMVHSTGLTVSLEHISFEDVIRDADVSRSSAYRRWPHKDLFFSDLVKQLASEPTPATVMHDELDKLSQIVARQLDWLETPTLRRSLLLELIRELTVLDFEALFTSPGWRTYIALHATFMSLPDGELREQVRAALARSEHDRIARIAKAWEQLAALLGYRLRPEAGGSFETPVILADATMRGLIIMALSAPELAARRSQASPFGAAREDEWSLGALGMAGIAQAFLEPDPAVKWDADRIASVRQALATLSTPDA